MAMTECQKALVRYGIQILTSQLQQGLPTPDSLGVLGNEILELNDTRYAAVRRARELLRDASLEARDRVLDVPDDLVSIFSLVERGHDEPTHHQPLSPLSFGGPHLSPDHEDEEPMSRAELFERFIDTARQIPAGEGMFETFFSVMNIYGWRVPSSLSPNYSRHFDPVGVSLFEQFKAVAALACCLDGQGDGTNLLLVAGDIPGIQAMLYTITSRGAAKSLRGRSIYLQLLNDAVVRSLLVRLRLPWANVIYNAGGNFKILVHGSAEKTVSAFRAEMNAAMLQLHGGELYVALAWVPISAIALIDNVSTGDGGELAGAMRRLADALDEEKSRWFAELVVSDLDAHYRAVFGPFGRGGPISRDGELATICQVCHADVTEENRQKEGDVTYCAQCLSFEQLARDVTKARYLRVESASSRAQTAKPQSHWCDALNAFGFRYEFLQVPPHGQAQGRQWLYQLNSVTSFIGTTGNVAYGVRALANLTPRMRAADGQEVIRDLDTMAERDAAGIKRYGVLRMDVDSLGIVFGGKLRFRDLLHTSALSAAVSLFFEGQLGPLCRAAADRWRREMSSPTILSAEEPDAKVPYIIYAGGDDLFIVGCWDVLPEIAREIREAFGEYTHGRLTLSAGVALGHKKCPLYQASELAGGALKKAKRRRRPGEDGGTREKEAVTFLGVPLGWEELRPVRECTLTLVRLLKGVEGSAKAAPKALLSVLGEAAAAYRKELSARGIRPPGLGEAEPGTILLGPWFWRLTYGLRRMATRVDPVFSDDIVALNYGSVEHGSAHLGAVWRIIGHLGLAVRWAEFLVRREEARDVGAR